MKWLKPITALMLLLLLAAAAVAQDNPPKAGGGTPKLAIESPIHDFGQVKSGTPLHYTFKVKNEGSADLLIQNVQPG
ncbi:MAG TPA: DUF1573 domain-containing protein [Blastocatellia bacterium]|nr:DUF1573 domain-containing protein [Blastocatellia bacterium]